jgi:UDP-N-acetylmuramoyl-tripeptide--D-alanyl-D-alanine ligase
MIKPINLHLLRDYYGGECLGNQKNYESLSIDTRTIEEGDLFVALRGENFDAHDYLDQALEKGAAGFVIEKEKRSNLPSTESMPVWLVEDTTVALGYIAQYQREFYSKHLIAVTGSNGKTTVKGMLAAIFSAYVGKASVFATRGNLNNQIGVPLSLLELTKGIEYAVIEMGASGPGEIAYLSEMAKPTLALVNNVMPAHVEGFGSIDAIATAKGAIYESLTADGIAVVNGDDHYAEQWLIQNHHRKVCIFSATGQTDQKNVFARNRTRMRNGCYSFCLVCNDQSLVVKLGTLGEHNISNAVAAAACATSLGLDIEFLQKGLESYQGDPGRLQVLKGIRGCVLLDDTYNANPGSAKVAIDVLSEMEGEKILVLGDMAELGDEESKLHAEVGLYALEKNINQLLSLGAKASSSAQAFGENAAQFFEWEALVEFLSQRIHKNVSILVKGSRSSRMERVIKALQQSGEQDASLAC